MLRFVLHLVVTAVALWVATLIIPGIEVGEGGVTGNQILTLLLVAVVFGVINAFIKPLVTLLTLPLTILTLGLFLFVVNALMLMLTSWLSGIFDLDFSVSGFWAALFGGIVIAIVNWVLGMVIPDAPRRARA